MFNSIKKNNIKWTIRDNLEENILDNLYLKLKDFASCPDFSIVKDNNVRTVLFLEPGQNTPDRIFVKLYKKGSLGVKAKHLVIPSKAYSEWKGLNYFVNKGLPCPEPLAFSEKKRFGLLDESCLLIKGIPSAFPLNEYFKNKHLRYRSINYNETILIVKYFIEAFEFPVFTKFSQNNDRSVYSSASSVTEISLS